MESHRTHPNDFLMTSMYLGISWSMVNEFLSMEFKVRGASVSKVEWVLVNELWVDNIISHPRGSKLHLGQCAMDNGDYT